MSRRLTFPETQGFFHSAIRKSWIIFLFVALSPVLVYAQQEVMIANSGVNVVRRYQEQEIRLYSSWMKISQPISAGLSLEELAAYIRSTSSIDRASSTSESSLSIDVTKDLKGYSLTCISDNLKTCRKQLDSVEQSFFSSHNEAIQRGITDVQELLGRQLNSVKQLQQITNNDAQLSFLQLYEIEILAKQDVLSQLQTTNGFSLYFVGETSGPQWDFLRTTTTYLVSMLIGGLIGLMMVLQLALNSWRSAQQDLPNRQPIEPT
jgi:hypothetical protein